MFCPVLFLTFCYFSLWCRRSSIFTFVLIGKLIAANVSTEIVFVLVELVAKEILRRMCSNSS
jgi:hypothetical protein